MESLARGAQMHLRRFVTSSQAPACDSALLASRNVVSLLSQLAGLRNERSSGANSGWPAAGVSTHPFGTWSGSSHGSGCGCATCAESAASASRHSQPGQCTPAHGPGQLQPASQSHHEPATAAGGMLQPLGLLPPLTKRAGSRHLMSSASPAGQLPGSHASAARGLLQLRPLEQQRQQQQQLQPASSHPHHQHQHQQLRQLSGWRRLLPSWQDFRNSAEGPFRQVTNLFLAINVATYLAARFDRGVVLGMAAIPHQIAAGELYRLLTAGFLHTDFLHLLSNMLALHWLGPDLESAAGRGRFAAIYLTAVLAGSAAQYALGGWGTVSWGASGGVSGLFAGYVTYRLRNRAYTGWSSGDISWVLQVVGLNVFLSLAAGGSLAHWAHLGGALGGAAAVLLLGPRYRWRNGFVVDEPLLPLFRSRR
ncbi:hypothetical protein HYH02_008920 [Chlamydomonas schloesseri]|uniref:Peptidase S54 rhomboid domain-containing protein n=1 Tax=Chlamydomonas schloesseri TaxID=2026947 RepID=A0A835WCV1_9CHLO|nr:hypothetical protein HYH02_008920 [Chlamydomonas schloesseri]|eukprot:KAG2445052.1 hypothetical protein HYH02_008920 [Chlamydomonas schloesseri]